MNALDERLAALEKTVAAHQQYFGELQENVATFKESMNRIQEILDEGIQVTPDPEVEVDLVYPEDEEVTVELPQEEQVESTESSEKTEAPEVIESPENPENTDNPENPEPQPTEEPAVEPEPAPVEEPQPEEQPMVEQPVAEQPKAEAPRMPQQTSLFGAPVTDIRQAVSIGDRFLFQRELFAGNAEKLQQTLTELDKLGSLDEAVSFIDRFGWDKQSSTFELFLNVLRRRFQ